MQYAEVSRRGHKCRPAVGIHRRPFYPPTGHARAINLPGWVVRHRHQACFNRVVKNAVPVFPKTLTPQQVKAMSETFETECLR